MLGGFWRYASSARGEAWTALRRETLACVVAALRARQARVLPRFAAADDVPESAAGAAAPPPRPFGALLLARLAGEAGLGWLGREPAALRALAAYFGDGPSELRAIAEEAERRIGLPLDRRQAESAPDPTPAEEAAAAPRTPRHHRPRRPIPSPPASAHRRPRSAARVRAGSGSTGCGQDSATAQCRSTPPAPGCNRRPAKTSTRVSRRIMSVSSGKWHGHAATHARHGLAKLQRRQ